MVLAARIGLMTIHYAMNSSDTHSAEILVISPWQLHIFVIYKIICLDVSIQKINNKYFEKRFTDWQAVVLLKTTETASSAGRPDLLFKPKYRSSHPENYIIYFHYPKKYFPDQSIQKNILFYFENRSTEDDAYGDVGDQSPSVYLPVAYNTMVIAARIGLMTTNCRTICLQVRTNWPFTCWAGRQHVPWIQLGSTTLSTQNDSTDPAPPMYSRRSAMNV